jgi:hypothetical protein
MDAHARNIVLKDIPTLYHLRWLITCARYMKTATLNKGPSTRVQIALQIRAQLASIYYGFQLSFRHQLQLLVNTNQEKSIKIILQDTLNRKSYTESYRDSFLFSYSL